MGFSLVLVCGPQTELIHSNNLNDFVCVCVCADFDVSSGRVKNLVYCVVLSM